LLLLLSNLLIAVEAKLSTSQGKAIRRKQQSKHIERHRMWSAKREKNMVKIYLLN
jgi:hypothetical protein